MEKENQRVALSKELIKNACLTLSKTEEKKHITVSKLCKVAGISRDTFYNHYHSVDDVFTEIYGQVTKELILRIRDFSNVKTLKRNLIAYLNYIRDHSLLFETVFLSQTAVPEEMKNAQEEALRIISGMIHEEDEKTRQMEAFFLFSGMLACITEWLRNLDSHSTAEMAEFILACSQKIMR